MTAEARSDDSFAPDGVYQPTPETADNGLAHIDTPEPLDESSEPEPGHPQPMPSLEGSPPILHRMKADRVGSGTGWL